MFFDFWETLQLWIISKQSVFVYTSYFILTMGLTQNIIYIIQLPLAMLEVFKLKLRDQDSHTWWLTHTDIALPISIFIPAYNEGAIILKNVHSSLALQYPTYEVIVINDGSTDDTLKKLINEFQLTPSKKPYEYLVPCANIKEIYSSSIYENLIVVDKDNGKGKSDALNAAINVARHPIFCTLDADSVLEPSALLKTIQPFIDEPETTVAVGGTVRILNGCYIKNGVVEQAILPQKMLPKLQVIEYLRAFLMGRLAWRHLGILTIVSGAFTVIQRDIVINVGGFDNTTLGEDYDLILKVHKYMHQHNKNYRVCFVPEPVCWTEAPETLEVLRKQRIRWQQGALEGFFHNIDMFCNPRYGRIGLLSFPLSFIRYCRPYRRGNRLYSDSNTLLSKHIKYRVSISLYRLVFCSRYLYQCHVIGSRRDIPQAL